ncbi:DNA-methyltransferase [Calditerrivibrio nitroreducens]|uniref:Methyltransferase n=1 Tax=Calditerrivibrio nitroreducens (strain DSM 19672 / NBRC 101217 / Yu37-1) TaxID=768670 RepID=E4TKB8_CALNY|nr:site-specific DNA-methyltransferase [Calditerrivibrio nitroreducens]ADR19990.1 DNA methylase N-4/N-6 domain protein [Calditerrivibrio nitroreducens DSM 19672]
MLSKVYKCPNHTEYQSKNVNNEDIFNYLIEKLKAKTILHHKRAILLKGDVLNNNYFENDIFDLIVTSPPYNVDIKYNTHKDNISYEEYLQFSEAWLSNCYKWSKKQARLCLNIPLDKNKGGQRSVGADLTILAQKVGWKYHSTIIWNEGNISRRTAWGSWLSASAPYVIAPVELIVILYKEEWKKTQGTRISDISKDEFMQWTNGLWTFNGESKKRIGHPAPFPLELPYRCIKLFSFVQDIVFDPFAGSGTTLIAANNTNRYSIGLEIDSSYCELSKQRVLQESEMLF